MFAVICSPQFWKEIEQSVSSLGEEILLKAIDNDIDVNSELQKIGRISIKHLIIDITSISDHKKLIHSLIQYKILNDKTQIIVIAPNSLPGNELINNLVSQVHVYDIISPKGEKTDEMIILPSLLDCIKNPSSYKSAVKWIVESEFASSQEEVSATRDKTRVIEKETERTVTITKEKIIGTVVIAIAGTIKRIGTTHTTISVSKFLKENNFRVALVELHKSDNFQSIKNSYEDVQAYNNYFSLDGLDYYPYSEELNLLDVLQEDYNYVVLDMGKYSECNVGEFKRATSRIIVSGVKDWELTDLELILRTGDTIYKNKYYFTFSDKYSFDMIKANMDQLKCYQAPMNPNPFVSSKDCSSTFKDILKDVIPDVNKINNSKSSKLIPSFKDLVSKVGLKGGKKVET